MDLDIRRGSLLAVFWLLTAACAFVIGRGAESSHAAPPQKAGNAHSPGSPGATEAAREDDGGPDAKAVRKDHTVGRFISVTRRLSDDELSRLLPEMTEKMDLEDVYEALRRLESVRAGPARRLARFNLINRLAQLDAMAAFEVVEAMPESELRDQFLREAVKGWATVDPRAAHEWVTATSGEDKEALQAVWEGIAKTNDLEKALAFIPSLGAGSNGYSQPYEIWDVYMTLHELYRMDDKAVTEWVEGLPPGELRDRSFHSIVDQLARHDPLAAKDWIEEQADAGNRSEAYVELAESWARHDPEAAVEWVATLPPNTPGLRRIYERLFTRFIQYDYLDAANYLVEQEPSPALDTAYEVYIDTAKTIDPEATMDWAMAITDETRRWSAMQEVANAWRGRDAAALSEFVNGLELSEEQQVTLRGSPSP